MGNPEAAGVGDLRNYELLIQAGFEPGCVRFLWIRNGRRTCASRRFGTLWMRHVVNAHIGDWIGII